MYHWYLEHGNEVMIDLDRVTALSLRETRRQVEECPLDIHAAYLFPSESPMHMHLVLRLNDPAPAMVRWGWALLLGNDGRRAGRALLRHAESYPSPALLITSIAWNDYYRSPDLGCNCLTKHRTTADMAVCPAALQLAARSETDPGTTRWEIDSEWRTYGRVYLRERG